MLSTTRFGQLLRPSTFQRSYAVKATTKDSFDTAQHQFVTQPEHRVLLDLWQEVNAEYSWLDGAQDPKQKLVERFGNEKAAKIIQLANDRANEKWNEGFQVVPENHPARLLAKEKGLI
eukprot:TRINITY_DN427_c0_g1_i1.p1 TRINITY_DN427_c0_g1~~TRINITY_DN427_c0_g1_i1.p1  ORF type:complete len:118 (+),score=34.36 TRINITY_DN427_c0_g1_i1:72-425(+)